MVASAARTRSGEPRNRHRMPSLPRSCRARHRAWRAGHPAPVLDGVLRTLPSDPTGARGRRRGRPGRDARRDRRRTPPRAGARAQHPADADDAGARLRRPRGEPRGRSAHASRTSWRPSPTRSHDSRRTSTIRDDRFGTAPDCTYASCHVLDHAHEAPRSGQLPHALVPVSNVLTGRISQPPFSRLD